MAGTAFWFFVLILVLFWFAHFAVKAAAHVIAFILIHSTNAFCLRKRWADCVVVWNNHIVLPFSGFPSISYIGNKILSFRKIFI